MRVLGVAAISAAGCVSAWIVHAQVIAGADHELPLVVRLVLVFFTLEALRMFIQIVIGATFYREALAAEPGDDELPTVTVIVPAWNEQVGISRTLASVLASDYPSFDVMVVDDGSTDDTAAIVEQWVRAHPGVVTLIRQPNGGKGRALNNGVHSAFGEVIVNLDADSVITPMSLRNMAKRFTLKDVDAVVGRVELGNTSWLLARIQGFEYRLGFHLRRFQSTVNTIYILSGAFCAYRRSTFMRTKGFRDYSKTEDLDFSLQLRELGMRLLYAEDAVCLTEGAVDLRSLTNQRTRWKYGGMQCLRHHRHLLFDTRKGRRMLGWYELPMSVLGYLQTASYPLILTFAITLPLLTGELIYLVLIMVAVPFNHAIVFVTAGLSLRNWHLIAMTPYMLVAMMVEHVATVKAASRVVRGSDVSWTNWSRVGVDSNSSVVPQEHDRGSLTHAA